MKGQKYYFRIWRKTLLVFTTRRIDFAASMALKWAGGNAESVKVMVEEYDVACNKCASCLQQGLDCKRSCDYCKLATETNMSVPTLVTCVLLLVYLLISAAGNDRPCSSCCEQNHRLLAGW